MFREFHIFVILLVLTTNMKAVYSGSAFQNLPHTSGKKNYLHKCCPVGEYVGKYQNCVKYNGAITSLNIEVYDDDLNRMGKLVEDVFRLEPGKFQDKVFKNQSLDVTVLNYNIYVTESGVLKLELPNAYDRWTLILRDSFCVDYRIKADRKNIRLGYWAIIPDTEYSESNLYLTGTTMVSCFFILLVLIVYFLLPELQNLCGMILMAYVASLFMAFLLLVIIQVHVNTVAGCIGLTMGIYFFFLASFCWMNIMSYDIWWTFRGYVKVRPINRRGQCCKFLMYCLYGWGVPLIMTIALAVINEADMSHMPWFITPQVPHLGCFFGDGVKLLYLYMPMLILIIFNWTFYLMTAFNIWWMRRGTAVLDSAAAGQQAHRSQKQRFMVYVKLSIVMGLNWVLEIVSFQYPGFKMWYISDVYNSLIGFAIFLIFVCKKKIFRKLCKRYVEIKTNSWHPSSKSYSRSITDSNNDSHILQKKVSCNPRGMNEYPMSPVKNR